MRQPDDSLVERTVEYEYDELYRLIKAAVLGGETITYTYDAVGNRISAGARNYIYDENDRLIEEREGGEVVVSYSYDDNGNLLSRSEDNQRVNYVWDDQNRLVAVEENGEVIEFEYDDDNIRISQTVGGEKTSFLLDKNRPYAQVLGEFVGEEEVASYLYGLDLISQERNGEDWFYFVDGLGSTRGLTDGDGGVTDAYWYDAYGNLVEKVGSSENDYLFAGEQFDEELGQYYLRQRYYDAAIGRFTRRDTWEGRLNKPITLNKYLYANGNPVSYIDPSGYIALYQVVLYTAFALSVLGATVFYGISYHRVKRNGPFDSAEEAALDALNKILTRSIQENREYGGLIYQDGQKFYYSPAKRGTEDSVNVSLYSAPYPIIKPIADYHTHGGKSTDGTTLDDFFSLSDVMSNDENYIDGYLGTPCGAILHYTHNISSLRRDNVRLLQDGKDCPDDIYRNRA